jgi:hypothetical protein
MEYLAGITNSPGGSFWRVIDITTGIPPVIFGGISADDESRHADVHEAKHEGDALGVQGSFGACVMFCASG